MRVKATGATQLAVTPYWPSEFAQENVKPTMPILAAA
jgi:hypothetical protein